MVFHAGTAQTRRPDRDRRRPRPHRRRPRPHPSRGDRHRVPRGRAHPVRRHADATRHRQEGAAPALAPVEIRRRHLRLPGQSGRLAGDRRRVAGARRRRGPARRGRRCRREHVLRHRDGRSGRAPDHPARRPRQSVRARDRHRLLRDAGRPTTSPAFPTSRTSFRTPARRRCSRCSSERALSTAERFDGGDGPCGAAVAPGVAGRTAFTLRVQTGCDERCSYCIIPTTRGHEAGRNPLTK